MASKHCPDCERDLPTSDFYPNRQRPGALQSYCRDCHRKRSREHARANPRDPAQVKAYMTQYRKDNPGANREASLKSKYGITLAAWETLFDSQGRACAICKRSKPGRHWHTDHCHDGGHVRGILCANCNIMLGYAEDNSETLQRASTYLLLS